MCLSSEAQQKIADECNQLEVGYAVRPATSHELLNLMESLALEAKERAAQDEITVTGVGAGDISARVEAHQASSSLMKTPPTQD